MTVWAIIPVKPLLRGKSRLAPVLSPKERAMLNRELLIHTLDTLKEIPQIDQVLVVSRDTAVLSLAREQGARTLQEKGHPQLNVALTRAIMVAHSYGIPGVLVIPSDLPLINSSDVEVILELGSDPPVVVVVPDWKREGTNALLVNPPGFISPCFGPKSFERHCQAAREAGARLEVFKTPSLAMDIDLPEDLHVLHGVNLRGLEQVYAKIPPQKVVNRSHVGLAGGSHV